MSEYSAKPFAVLEGNQPGSQKRPDSLSASDYLPQYLQTDIAKRFLDSTLDLMLSSSSLVTLDHYVGQKTGDNYNSAVDKFLPTDNAEKLHYNGAPAFVKNRGDGTAERAYTFYDFKKNLQNIGDASRGVGNNNLSYKETYTYSPPIDNDKFANYKNYYWHAYDLPTINIKPNAAFDPDDIIGLARHKIVTTDLGTIDLLNGFRIRFVPLSVDIHTGDGTETVFSTDGTGANIIIKFDGDVQDVDYTIDTSANTITFTTAPANGVTVAVEYHNLSNNDYLDSTYIVDGVGKNIYFTKLVDSFGKRVLSRQVVYTPFIPVPWDSEPWDSHPWDTSRATNLKPEYVVMERGAKDHNAYSRVNQWYHESAITSVCTILDLDVTDYITPELRAKRPIIEFEKDLVLYDHGIEPDNTQKFPLHQYYVDFMFDTVASADIVGETTYSWLQNVALWSSSTEYNAGDRVKLAIGSGFYYFEAVTNSTNRKPYDFDTATPDTKNWKRIYDVALQDGDVVFFLGVGGSSNNRVYRVGGVEAGSITLNEILDPQTNDKVHIKFGPRYPVDYQAAELVWYNDKWNLPPQKTYRGQAPLFDLYDEDSVALSSYDSTDFNGNSIFEYLTNTGATIDQEIGIRVKYKSGIGASEAMFTSPITYAVYSYDLSSSPKQIKGELKFKTSTTRTDNSCVFSTGWQDISDIDKTNYVSDFATVTSGKTYTFEKIGRNQIAQHGQFFHMFMADDRFTVYNQVWSNNKLLKKLPGQNPDIYLYAGTTATFRVDSITPDLQFVKEIDASTAAPGVTVTDNGDTLSVEIDADSSNYDPVFLYTSASDSSIQGRVRIVDMRDSANNLPASYNFIVYHNDNITDDYELFADELLVRGVKVGDNVEVRYIPNTDSYRGNYVVSPAFANNPFNREIEDHTYSNLLAHFTNKIQTLPHFYETQIGLNDYYISSKDHHYGGTVFYHKNSRSVAPYITDDSNNVIRAVRSLMNEYDRFKARLVNKARQVNSEKDYTTTRELFNETLRQMNIGKDNKFRYSTSGMLLWQNAKTKTFTITQEQIDDGISNLEFALDYNISSNSFTGLHDHAYVYLKQYVSGVSKYETRLLTKDLHYTVDTNLISLTSDLTSIDPGTGVAELIVDYYYWDQPSFVPPSSVKLHLAKPQRPYVSGTTLYGHDGAQHTVGTSTNTCHPELENYDIERAILFELETRVWQSVETDHYNDYHTNIQTLIPTYHDIQLEWKTKRSKWIANYKKSFDYWISSTGRSQPSFKNSDATKNYNHITVRGEKLPGTEDKVIEYYTGTATPLTTPWEMLGYVEKPSWWDEKYSWTDATKRTALLAALTSGLVSNPDNADIVNIAHRPDQDLGALIDSSGVQTDIETAWSVGTGSTTNAFVFGDGYSSQEQQLEKTSAYPFVLLETLLRTDAQHTWSMYVDPSSINVTDVRNVKTLVNKKTRRHSSIQDPVYGSPIPRGTIVEVRVISEGKNYDGATTAIIQGDGKHAEIALRITDGKIKGASVTKGGYGFVKTPVVEFDDPSGNGSGAKIELDIKEDLKFRTSGCDAIVWYSNNNSQQSKNNHNLNQLMSVQPAINVEGYTDKNLIKIRLPGSSTSKPYTISDNDLQVMLHKSHNTDSFNFSSVRVTRTSAGWKADGFVHDPKEFAYVTPAQSSASRKKLSGTREITYYTEYDTKATTVQYGTVFSNLQELSNFFAGYLAYLEQKRFVTWDHSDEVTNLLDWAALAKVGDDRVFATAKELQVENQDHYFLDNIRATNYHDVLVNDTTEDSLSRAIGITEVKVDRHSNNTVIRTVDSENIVRVNLNFVEYEHLLVLNNHTAFGDIVYSTDLGLKNKKYKLEGRKTSYWTGRPSTKGYLVNDTGLTTNFETSVAEVERDTFSIDSNMLNNEKRKTALTNIGYNKPEWAEHMPISDDNAFDHYKTALPTKGTKENLTSLARNDKLVNHSTDSFEINEEWLVKSSDFASDSISYIEFEFDSDQAVVNPQGIGFTEDGRVDQSVDDTILYNVRDKRLVTPLSSKNVFTLGSNYYNQTDSTFDEFEDWLKVAGYPLMSETDIRLLNVADIASIYDSSKEYAQIELWRKDISYKRDERVRYADRVWQCAVNSTGFETTREPIVWHGTVTSPIVASGGTLVIDGVTVNLTNTVTSTSYDAIVINSVENPVVNGGDTLIVDNVTVTFAKTVTTTTYPDFSVNGTIANFTIPDDATDRTLIIQGTTVNFDGATAYDVDAVVQAINDASIANIAASNVSDQLVITRSGRTASDKDLVIGAGTANSIVGLTAGTTTGSEVINTNNAAQLTNTEIVNQINNTLELAALPIVAALNSNRVRLTKTATVNDPNMTLSGTAVSDLGNEFVTGTINGVATTVSSTASLDVILVAEAINDADITGITATVINNRIVISSTNSTAILNNTPAANTLGIATNTLGVTRSAATGVISNTFDENEWQEINEPLLEYIWVADDNALPYSTIGTQIQGRFNSWNVLKVMDLNLYAIRVCGATLTSTGNDAEIVTNKAHNLQVGDYVMLLNSNSYPRIDGIHKITELDSTKPNAFFIDEYIETEGNYTKVLVIRPMRFSTTAQRDLAYANAGYNFEVGDLVWVDSVNDGFAVFAKDTNDDWATERTQSDYHVSQSTINSAILHNGERRLLSAEVYDPMKGIIPGLADADIDFKDVNDPAIYTNSSDLNASLDDAQSWARDKIGTVWWDTSNAIYIDYEQSTIEYRTKHWGELFEGASIDIYEWTKSSSTPDQWFKQVVGGAELDGEAASGEAYYQMVNGEAVYYYTESNEYDNATNTEKTFYYFWVKNKVTIPSVQNRRTSVLQLTNLISDPTAQNINWIAATGKDSFIASNVENSANKDTFLQIKIKSTEGNMHSHWHGIVENKSAIPEYYHRRLADSITGRNRNRMQHTFKNQWDANTAYIKDDVVYADSLYPPIKVTVAAKTTDNHNYGRGATDGFFFNGTDDEAHTVFTFQRDRTYIFDQTDSSNLQALTIQTEYEGMYRGFSPLTTELEYFIDGEVVSVTDYQTAVEDSTNTADKHIIFTPTKDTPTDLYIGSRSGGRKMGNRCYVIDSEKEEKAYYQCLTASTGVYPQISRSAWRRVWNVKDEDAVEQTIQLDVPKSVPDYNLHPLDLIGESVRPSRTWFGFKQDARKEVFVKLNNMLINTPLLDLKPDYADLLEKAVTVHAKDYTITDWYQLVDYVSKDYDQFRNPNRTIDRISPDLTSRTSTQLVGEYDGEYVLAKNVLHADGIRRDSVYQYDTEDDVWNLVYKEKGTIKFNSFIWDSFGGGYGFDTSAWDNGGFDADPIVEIDKLLDILYNDLLADSDYNRIWFAAIYNAIQYSNNDSWLMKSSYIVPQLEREVTTDGSIPYDSFAALNSYIDQNKPYSAKTDHSADGKSKFVEANTVTDSTGLVITDSHKQQITLKENQYLANTFTENQGETGVTIGDQNDQNNVAVVNHPLTFADVQREYVDDNGDTHLVRREPVFTTWKTDNTAIVTANTAEPHNEQLIDVKRNISSIAWDRDYVYIRTSGVSAASGGPRDVVAPEAEDLATDQTPANAAHYNWKIPAEPVQNTAANKTNRAYGPIGVFTNGVTLMSPRDKEEVANGYYRNEARLRADFMDANNGTVWCSIGDYEPPVAGVYYHYDLPNEYKVDGDAGEHSPIIGWALDGYPIYGPHTYANTDGTGAITRMTSSYTLRSGARPGAGSPSGVHNGDYTADYEYTSGHGTLDEHNGRYCVTPEFPDGTYAYFATPTEYPYFIGDTFRGVVSGEHRYQKNKTIEPYLPNIWKLDGEHTVTLSSSFADADDDLDYVYNAQTFLNRFEQHGRNQYFAEVVERLQLRVQTNTSGDTAGPNSRSWIYFQDNVGNIISTVAKNSSKDTTSGAVTREATEIPVSNVGRFYDPGQNVGQLGAAEPGYAWIGNELIKYHAISNGNLIGCERGWHGTTAQAHSSGTVMFDASHVARVPVPRQLHSYGDALILMYNDDGVSITNSAPATSFEARIIRAGGRGEIF